MDRFGGVREKWRQVQVIANGEYEINHLKGSHNSNIKFDIVIHEDELEVIVLAGTKTYEIYGDFYGLNPMRYFEMKSDGRYALKKMYHMKQCKDCRNPWCVMKGNKGNDIIKISVKVKDKYPN